MRNYFRKYPRYFYWKKYSLGIFEYIFTDFTKLAYKPRCYFLRKQLIRANISLPTKFFRRRLKICAILVFKLPLSLCLFVCARPVYHHNKDSFQQKFISQVCGLNSRYFGKFKFEMKQDLLITKFVLSN